MLRFVQREQGDQTAGPVARVSLLRTPGNIAVVGRRSGPRRARERRECGNRLTVRRTGRVSVAAPAVGGCRF